MYAIYSTTLYKICKCIKLLNKRAQGSTEEIFFCALGWVWLRGKEDHTLLYNYWNYSGDQ
nr:MAG TPA: hypothetical protein [Caudoviricetes sp.]